MAFGGAILAKPLLQITQTPAELLEPASAYLRMVFWGIPFSMLYNMLGAVMRSFGETKMPLYALVVSSIINLVLNIVFVKMAGASLGLRHLQLLHRQSLAYICWFNSEKNS